MAERDLSALDDEGVVPSLFKRSIEGAARARLALPLLLVLALVGMFVNEATYQHTIRTLGHGITLTDARLESARALQLLTELEAAARAYAATRSPDDRRRFDEAAQALPQAHEKALRLLAQVGGQNPTAQDVDAGTSLRQWVEGLRSASRPEAAFDAAQGRERRTALSEQLDAALNRMAGAQQGARINLYDAFQLSRGAIHGLIVLAVIAMVMFARQLRRADARQLHEHARLEAQILERTAELRDLAGHLVSAREDERARVARELHDDIGGLLTSMSLELARLKRIAGLPLAASERLASLDKRIHDGMAVKRRIVGNLWPLALDQLGLQAAVEALCQDTATTAGMPVHVSLQDVDMDDDAKLDLFRVVQESLTNVKKYAGASAVWVTLVADTQAVQLTVKDDGRGFDPAAVKPGHHGILGMRLRIEARGGSLQVHSRPGAGTVVDARWPRAVVAAADGQVPSAMMSPAAAAPGDSVLPEPGGHDAQSRSTAAASPPDHADTTSAT